MSEDVAQQEILIDLNIIEETIIKTKNYGKITIYKIKPCEYYSKIELGLLTKNNPEHFIYDPKEGCFYINDFSRIFLTHESKGVFYTRFLNATKKNKLGEPYFDACQKYLRRYARSKMTDEA